MEGQTIRAVLRRVSGSAQKTRLVINEVRGMKVMQALTLLKNMPNAAARPVYKVIHSAAANAEENFALNREDLIIKAITADEGATRKWRKYGARGRWKPILKRSSHITVELTEAQN